MTLRNLARIGATGALAVGALGLAATPALAADVDFGIDVSDTVIAADSAKKDFFVSVANKGTTKPDELEVVFDTRALDSKKVKLDTSDCSVEGAVATCAAEGEFIPAPDGTSDLALDLVKVKGATGAAGKITVTVKVAGDTVKANDSKTVDVSIGDNGVDLVVVAQDVTAADSKGEPTGKPVAPGAVAPLWVNVVNRGDRTAAGVKLVVELPKQTTFAEPFPGCTQSADKRTVTCNEQSLDLVPADEVGAGQWAGITVPFPVRVSPDAKGPVALKDGVVTVTAIAQKDVAARKSRAAAELPEGFTGLTAAQVADIDVDLADNSDGFAVLVAGPAAGSGGGDAGDGGNGDGGGLPVTGPAGLALGGGGLAAVALGLGLFLAARRRRVVLVTPGDER